jgi:co-chaperonin GroES (HSP10)
MTPIVPLGARVLVEPLQPETVTPSGVVLVEQHVPETMGRVVAVGAVVPPLPPDSVRVGDVVLFSWQDGQELLMDGARRIMLHQDDLLAVLDLEGAV